MSDGWTRIKSEVISFSKINNQCTATLNNITSTPQIKKNEHTNLHEDSEKEQEEEEQPNNGVCRITQGDEYEDKDFEDEDSSLLLSSSESG